MGATAEGVDVRPTPDTWRLLARLLALGVAIVVLGELSIRSAPAGTEVAAWWPAAGLAVTFGLRLGRPRLPAVVAVTLLASLVANLLGGREPGVSVWFSAANATEVAVTCALVLAWNPTRRTDQTRALVASGAAAAVGAMTAGIAAGLAVSTLLDGDLWQTTWAVAASHGSAVLLFLPFGLRGTLRLPHGLAVEATATGLALVAATLVVFAPDQSLPMLFLLFPPLVLAAFRQPLRVNAAHLIAVSATATIACAHGWGPVISAVQDAGLRPETSGTILQAFMASAAVMVYALRTTVESRQAALSETRNARSHLEAVIEAATSTAFIHCDLEGTIQVFNQGAVNMLGYSEQEMVGLATPERFHDPVEIAARAVELGVEPGFEVFVRGVRTGEATAERRDWTFITADGERKLVSLVVSRVEDAQGRLIGFLGVAEDVGAQRRVAQLLVQALDQERRLAADLRAADRLKDDFVSSVSHELRTPMTSILGYAELLAGEYGDLLDPRGTGMLDKVQANGRRLLNLVDDLLTLSRIESGALVLERTEIDLAAVVESATGVLEPLARDKQVTITADLTERPVPAQGDAHELERVVINLLSNAVKFTPPGGAITVRAYHHDGRPTLTVTDTGVGIPADELDAVFTRFHRAANADTALTPGTGIGLTIVKAIVERHGGTICATSELDQGTTVTITFPPTTAGPRPRRATDLEHATRTG